MTKRDFSYKTSEGVVMEGYVESEVDLGYNEVDYARVRLTSKTGSVRLLFSRDLVDAAGCKQVSEDLYLEYLDGNKVVGRNLLDVSCGRPHSVDLNAAGEWGKIVKEALASVGR